MEWPQAMSYEARAWAMNLTAGPIDKNKGRAGSASGLERSSCRRKWLKDPMGAAMRRSSRPFPH